MAEDMYPKPSVCRSVHYNHQGTCMAAIITQVYVGTGSVCLAVFPPNAHQFNIDAIDEGTEHDTWHWPERV